MSEAASDGAVLLYTTFPDEPTGLAIGEALVSERLASCVNLLPGMRSIYRWTGAVQQGSEVAALIKTRESLREAAASALRERHPYDTPIVLFIPVEADAATLGWLHDATSLSPTAQTKR